MAAEWTAAGELEMAEAERFYSLFAEWCSEVDARFAEITGPIEPAPTEAMVIERRGLHLEVHKVPIVVGDLRWNDPPLPPADMWVVIHPDVLAALTRETP